MMISGKLTGKGQVTVPKSVRDHLGIKKHDRLCFTPLGDGKVVLSACGRDASVAFGFLKNRPGKRESLTSQEIREIIEAERLRAGLGE
jgi:AbrB family looped-hinge helix DNA binding protein